MTAEAYPYAAGMTELASPLLVRFVNGPDSMFAKLMLVSTGERLTRATFTANRTPGAMVILFFNTPEMEALAVTSPLADADITVFDPARVADRSTYQQPALPSVGFRHVLVNGVPVVVDGAIQDGTYPGSAARGPVRIVTPE
ncbi:MAG: hypothetical protein H0T50_04890 [Gemmatimonadales bacterium]|nr:hypothetical protein [Gemmatimonadales bacterium]